LTENTNGPQRTCIACRQSKPQADLVRYVVAPNGDVLVDYRHRLPGRGAYTCLDLVCLKNAAERRQFQRSFRGRCTEISWLALKGGLTNALQQRITSLVGMARKAGHCISGSNAVINSLRQGDGLALVLVAEDISAGIVEKINELTSRHQVPCVSMFNKEKLGQLLGKEERSVVAIGTGSLADALLLELRRYLQMVREN